MLTFWGEETMNNRSEYTKCSIIVSTVEKSKTGKGGREWSAGLGRWGQF